MRFVAAAAPRLRGTHGRARAARTSSDQTCESGEEAGKREGRGIAIGRPRGAATVRGLLLLLLLLAFSRTLAGRHFADGDVKRAREARVSWELELPEKLEVRLDSKEELDLGQFLHEKDVLLPVTNERWDLLGPVGPKCLDVGSYGAGGTHLGKASSIADQEGKKACGLRHERNCTVVAIGSNGQWAFETDLVARTRCRVHTFDCTVAAEVAVPPELRHRVTLHRKCIGAPPVQGRNYFLEVPRAPDGRPGKWRDKRWRHGAFAAERFGRYAALLKLAGLRSPPTLLKMDVEGYEWPVLADVLSDPELAPSQLALELHFQTQMPGLRWFGRFKGAAEILSLGNALSRRGYLLVERDDNPACRWCSEQLWFRAGPSTPHSHDRAMSKPH